MKKLGLKRSITFKSTDFADDKDRVYKIDGAWTYFASDVAYHKNKLDENLIFLSIF